MVGAAVNLKQIEAFREVMASGSMTAAAQALNTTQPNVSRLIGKLEAATSLTLFVRHGNRLLPTEAGLAFAHEVERAYVGMQDLADAAVGLRETGAGTLRIAAVPTLAAGLLPRVVKRFEQTHPGTRYALYTGSSTTIVHWAASRFCDVGIVSHVTDIPGIEIEPLCEVEAVCVLPDGHPLATQRVVTPADLADERFIVPTRNDANRGKADKVFDDAGIRRQIAAETPFSSLLCSMVALGMGVGIVHPLVARDYARDGVIARRFAPTILMSSYLVFPRERPGGVRVADFEFCLRNALADELGPSVQLL